MYSSSSPSWHTLIEANFSVTLRLLSPQFDSSPIVRVIPLPATVGRPFTSSHKPGPNNGLFASSFISRRHAEIRLEGFQVVVEDLNSSNGTYHNGTLIKPHQPIPINEGDIIQFGIDDDPGNQGLIDSSASEHVVVVQVSFDPPSLSPSYSSAMSAISANGNQHLHPNPILTGTQSSLPTYYNPTRQPAAAYQRFNQSKGSFNLSSRTNPIGSEANGRIVQVDPLATKVASIVRKIAALGVNEVDGMSEGERQRLSEILDRFDQDLCLCSGESSSHEEMKSNIESAQAAEGYCPWKDHLTTVVYRPNIESSLRIIVRMLASKARYCATNTTTNNNCTGVTNLWKWAIV